MNGLTLEQKAAQMVMVRAYGIYRHPRSEESRDLVAAIRDLGVGGVIVFDSDLESIPPLLDRLQDAADLPLLVAADLERGLGFRVRRGSVSFPHAMAIGATFSEDAARFVGEVTAREGRALGIHWTFAPVADVNNNPANPIINVRSFGEDPELVARMTRAFVEGARSEGMLTSVKHFPGHGDTAIDSHEALPVLQVDRERLEAVELAPFREAIDAGVDSVMIGHIAVPSIDPTGTPATLSRPLSAGLLRDEMGFEGMIVTDALEMEGLRPAWAGGAAVRAVQAGTDVVLLPADTRVAIQSLVRAVEEGQLTEERLDASVRRILETKARLGLHRHRRVDRDEIGRRVARPEDVRRAAEMARASITVVRNEGDVLPLAAEESPRLLHVVISGSAGYWPTGLPEDELDARRVELETYRLGPEVSAETAEEIVALAPDFTHVVVSAFVRAASGETGAAEGGLSPSQVRLLGQLQETGLPVVLISFGSPYLLAHVPETPVYVCAYSWAPVSRLAAVNALFGESDIRGRLPVSLPGLYPYGHGIEIPRREMTLRAARPEDAGFRPGGLDEADQVLDSFLEQGAFPGGIVAVGYRGNLVHLRPFGKLAEDADAPAVAADTIYDLASLTKVIATTTMAMILVDEQSLELDSPVQEFLPRFVGEGKEKVTVRHLLTHSSGVDWWAPLYEEVRGQDAYVERIQAMDLVYEPGTDTKYSDLGLILLGEILERVAGQPLDAFVRERVFESLGMHDTLFRPPRDLLDRIAPTENDPWRGKVLRGEVHDENASALGGVAPHAGLFSTAGDLARFAQMMVNGGVLEHHRIVSRATVDAFTRRAGVDDSSRALGWDTKSPEKSSAGSLFSPTSFGHTGFTGTSIWIDPERELFLILLTNRVHPSRDNILIRKVRPALADAVVRALAEH
ncbi:MAG: serine hydrolase [bacterium]|nr:serine hydrolase [bacterium]